MSFATWRGERKTEGSGRFQRRPEVHWGGVGEGVVVERSTNRWARFKVVASTRQTLSTELNPICFQEQAPKLHQYSVSRDHTRLSHFQTLNTYWLIKNEAMDEQSGRTRVPSLEQNAKPLSFGPDSNHRLKHTFHSVFGLTHTVTLNTY